MRRVFERPAALVYPVLIVLGLFAVVLFFWNRPEGQQHQHAAPVAHSEDQDKALTEVKATQEKLATAQSALSMTTRLRDEAAQALHEVRDRSAGVRKELAAARDQLEDIRQKITVGSAELATITKRLDTARLRESQAKQKAETKSARPVAPPTPLVTTIVAPTPEKQPLPTKPAADATGSVSPSIATPPPATAIERRPSPIVQASPRAVAPPTPALKPSLESSSEPAPTPVRRSRSLADTGGTTAVIGPGAYSFPSDLELRGGRVSRTP